MSFLSRVAADVRRRISTLLIVFITTILVHADDALTLHIAADPNNLPFTNDRLEGFENKIADIIATDLHAKIEYTWHAQRRGFFRQTMREGDCDVVLGVPQDFPRTIATTPYYRSTYVFISREDRNIFANTFDDPTLRNLRVGVLLIGDENANPPPAHALASRGIITNLVGFSIYGDYKEQNPPARIIEAVANKQIDVAIVWGPLAGYFADKQNVPMRITPLLQESDADGLRYAFDICIGVKKHNEDLRDKINAALERHKAEITSILDSYHIPRAQGAAAYNFRSSGGHEALISFPTSANGKQLERD
jgi:mxaJ protein